MTQLNNLILVLYKLLISINHKKGFRIHFFEKDSFIIEKKFMLSDFILYSLLQLILFLVFNFIVLVLHQLIYLFLYILNFTFFLFYLFSKFANLLYTPYLVRFFNLIKKILLLLFINIVPYFILFRKFFFNTLAFQSWFFNREFKLLNSIFVVAWFVILCNTLRNFNLIL